MNFKTLDMALQTLASSLGCVAVTRAQNPSIMLHESIRQTSCALRMDLLDAAMCV